MIEYEVLYMRYFHLYRTATTVYPKKWKVFRIVIRRKK